MTAAGPRLPYRTRIAVGGGGPSAGLMMALALYSRFSPLDLIHGHKIAGAGAAQTETMINAVRSAGVRKIVLLSSIGARLEPLPTIGAALAAREEVLRHSGLDVTYLRPNTLMSNALWWADGIRKEGRVIDATGPGRMACVDPHDIARVAAVALIEDGHAGHGYILSGPEALTSREQVEITAAGTFRDWCERHVDAFH